MANKNKRRKLSRLSRYLLILSIFLIGLWFLGFFIYLNKISSTYSVPLNTLKEVNAIVVLTGGRGRLDQGLNLFKKGKSPELFISGVDSGVDKTTLLKNRNIDGKMLDCCINLGYNAENTFGNATETAHWIRSKQFSSLYLVTANYHMPRSLLEFQTALPEAIIIPHAVHPSNVHMKDWWRWQGTVRLLTAEYAKYIATYIRTILTR
ncbi:MAG: YdcF family protein [Alphaproteobacteria bacterium]|nr:YdcF family protein [Alphaproteobacteria bacterium]